MKEREKKDRWKKSGQRENAGPPWRWSSCQGVLWMLRTHANVSTRAPPHPSTAAMKSGLGALSTPHMLGRPHQGTGSHMAPPDRRSQVCRLRGTVDPKVSCFENKLWLHCTNHLWVNWQNKTKQAADKVETSLHVT